MEDEEFYTRVVERLAQPVFAGFQNNLAIDNFYYVLKRIAPERVDILLDEYSVEFGGRRNSLLEELHMEANIDLAELVTGNNTAFFGVVGEAGSGKTSMLRHLNWKINCRQEAIREFLKDDISTAYWHLKEKDEEEWQVHSKQRLLAIYIRASDIWRITQTRTENTLNTIQLIIDSASATFRRLVRDGAFNAEEEHQFQQALKELIPTSRVILLIDSLDLIPTASRPSMLNIIYNMTKPKDKQRKESGIPVLNNDSLNLFRVVMTSRPFALFNQPIPQDITEENGEEESNFVFLFLDKLFNLQSKERLMATIVQENNLDPVKHNIYNPDADAAGTDTPVGTFMPLGSYTGPNRPILDPHSDEARIQSKILRSLRSPVAIFLMAQLQEQSFMPVSVYDMFEAMVTMLKTHKPRTQVTSAGAPVGHELFDADVLDKLGSLFGFLYQCLISASFHHDFFLRAEMVKLIRCLVENQKGDRSIWDTLRSKYAKWRTESTSERLAENPDQELAEITWNNVTNALVEWNLCHALDSGELLFFDEQLVQFLCTRFLTDEQFSDPAIACLQHYHTEYPQQYSYETFSWKSSLFLTHTHWNFVYDLMGTKQGVVWMAARILPDRYKSIFDWLADIRLHHGEDVGDLGQLRFYRLLRAFALQQEDQVLLKKRLNQPTSSQPSPSTPEELEVAELKEAFGMTFISILEDNPSAIIHIEKAPVSSFGCFSRGAMSIIIEKLVDLLKNGTIMVVADLLLNLDKNKLISDDTVGKVIDMVVNPETDFKPLRPAIRFLTSRKPAWKHMGIVVNALNARDQDSQEEAAHALTKLGHASLEHLQRSMKSRAHLPPFLLYEEKDWTLLISGAASQLIEFVDLDLHHSNKGAHYYENQFEPKCRTAQCEHLPSLLTLLEHDNVGTRLFPFIALGSTIRSNMYDRDVEVRCMSSQVFLLEAIGRVYKPPDDCFGREAIDEMTKSDYAAKCIGYAFLELFGEHAAKFSVVVMDLIKSKIDLLQQISTWLWARIDTDARRKLTVTFLTSTQINPKIQPFLQRDILYLSTRSDYALQQIDQQDLVTVLNNTLLNTGNPKMNISIHRAALRFLDRTAVQSNKIEYKKFALSQIVSLLDRYFAALAVAAGDATGQAPIFTEYLLRVLNDMMTYKNGKFKKVLVDELQGYNLRAKLLTAFRSAATAGPVAVAPSTSRNSRTPPPRPTAQRFWYGKVLIAETLRHLISPDSIDAMDFLLFLNTDIELRAIAIDVLKRTSAEQAPKLVSKMLPMLEAEGDAFVRRSYVVLLGSLGRRDEPEIKKAVIDAALYLLGQDKNPIRQELGVSVLSVMGRDVVNYGAVEKALSSTLGKVVAKTNPKHAVGLTRDEIAMTLALVEAIPNLGLSSPQLVEALFALLWYGADSALRISVFLSFQKMVHFIPQSQLQQHEQILSSLLKAPEGYVRELAIKIIRVFGRPTVQRCTTVLTESLKDSEAFCRKQALKALSLLLNSNAGKKESLGLLPSVIGLLDDKNTNVVNQALKFISMYKSCRQLNVPRVPLFAQADPATSHKGEEERKPKQLQPSRSADSVDSTGPESGAYIGDDTFYVQNVVIPYQEPIVALLYKRRFKFNVTVKCGVFACLGETTVLHAHLTTYTEMLNTDDIATLVDFAETLRSLSPQMLQYIPPIVNAIKTGSPLVRNLVRLLAKHERHLDPVTCSKLFGLQTITQMMKNKDANVRKVAVSLMGKKVMEKPRHLFVLLQMWGDKNNKVRKEVMEVLGDMGRKDPRFTPMVMDTIDMDSVTSLLIWRFLSKSWGVLIDMPLPEEEVSDEMKVDK